MHIYLILVNESGDPNVQHVLEEGFHSMEVGSWKESHKDPEAPRIVSSRDQLRADQKQLIQMQNLGISFLRTAPADDDRGYARCQDEKTCWTLQKGKD